MALQQLVRSIVGSQNLTSTAIIEDSVKSKSKLPPITPAEADEIIGEMNSARRGTNPPAADMELVSWNSALQQDLVTFAAEVGPEYFFQQDGLGGYKGYDVMSLPQFAVKYPGYDYLIHDTTSTKRANGVSEIFQFRLNQKPCFNYAACSSTEYNAFWTCANLNPPRKTNCANAMMYYPWLVQATISELACVPLLIKGPSAPPGSDECFFCYGKYKNPNNDVPYQSGKQCSACPPETICESGLCMPTDAAASVSKPRP